VICTEDLSDILPLHICGKIVGVASYRGDFLVVACERGLFRVWDDGLGFGPRAAADNESERGNLPA
jgi:hypothetical protein